MQLHLLTCTVGCVRPSNKRSIGTTESRRIVDQPSVVWLLLLSPLNNLDHLSSLKKILSYQATLLFFEATHVAVNKLLLVTKVLSCNLFSLLQVSAWYHELLSVQKDLTLSNLRF